MDKLSNHEIDCFVSVEESRWEESEISPITSIERQKSIFCHKSQTSGYQKALDSAMRELRMTIHFTLMISTGVIFLHRAARFFQKKKGGSAAWSNPDRVSESDGGISSVDPSTGKLTGVITGMWILQKIVCKVRLWNLN